MAISSNQILKAVNCAKLDLVRVVGHAYWYFSYNDESRGIFETESIYAPRLNSMPLSHWVEAGKSFVKRMEEE